MASLLQAHHQRRKKETDRIGLEEANVGAVRGGPCQCQRKNANGSRGVYQRRKKRRLIGYTYTYIFFFSENARYSDSKDGTSVPQFFLPFFFLYRCHQGACSFIRVL